MTETFECDLRSLLGREVFFYDPYIVDEVKTNGSRTAQKKIDGTRTNTLNTCISETYSQTLVYLLNLLVPGRKVVPLTK